MNWLCIDDVLGTGLLWSSTDSTPNFCWNVQNVFTSAQTSAIFYNIFPSKKPMVVPLASLNSKIDLIRDMHILDIHFIPHSNGSVFKWMNSLAEILSMATKNYCRIYIISAWISDPFFNTSVCDQCRLYLQTTLSEHWTFSIQNYSLTNFGLQWFGNCWLVQLHQISTTDSFIIQKHFYHVSIGCMMFRWPKLLMSR